MQTVSRLFSRLAAGAAAALAVAAAGAQDFKPAIVYDFGGKFDRSFNQSASEGAERFKRETGIAYREFEITNQAQREQIMRQLARHGASIIAAIGFNQASAVEKVAAEFPAVKFVVVDGRVDLPNVESINFREQEVVLPLRHGGGPGIQNRQDRVCRRDGHPADPEVRPGLPRRGPSTPIPGSRCSRT